MGKNGSSENWSEKGPGPRAGGENRSGPQLCWKPSSAFLIFIARVRNWVRKFFVSQVLFTGSFSDMVKFRRSVKDHTQFFHLYC